MVGGLFNVCTSLCALSFGVIGRLCAAIVAFFVFTFSSLFCTKAREICIMVCYIAPDKTLFGYPKCTDTDIRGVFQWNCVVARYPRGT